MSTIVLTKDEMIALDLQHRVERDGRVRDRIKAVLLHVEGWSNLSIAQALRIRPETVADHLREYEDLQKLKPENGGSAGYLDAAKTESLLAHLEAETYTKALEICSYVKETYGVSFTVQGMTHWLHRHGFSYKQPKGIPSKACLEKQKEFIVFYESLLTETSEDEPILFGDGVHPTMATKISHGWIRRGVEKTIPTTGSRTRVNLFGALNLETMGLITAAYETIDTTSMCCFFKTLRGSYPKAPKIHLILDQGPYNISHLTQESARNHGIVLHYLPTYSPNLNPIERCWKVMNEHVRNNEFFKSAADFRAAISNFFAVIWPDIAHSLVDRINDNFQTLNMTSSR